MRGAMSTDDSGGPPPPWTLEGQGLVAAVAAKDVPAPPLRRLPGPVLVLAARWRTSPVGVYHEFAVVVPSRFHWWAGVSVIEMVVDSAASRDGGRVNWGMPKELGHLSWDDGRGRPRFRWEEQGIEMTPVRQGPTVPTMVPFPLLQVRHDGPVVAPSGALGRARPASIQVTVPPGASYAPLAGRHPGLYAPRLRLQIRPGRRVS